MVTKYCNLNLIGGLKVKTLKFKSKWHLSLLLTALVMALVFAFSSSAHALQLWITDGTTDIFVNDNEVGKDNDGALGVVSWSGSIGGFSTTVTTALTKPAMGSAGAPAFDLNTVQLSGTSVTAGNIRIRVSDTDFGPLDPGTAGWSAMIGGNFTLGTGSVTYDAYYDESNTLYGETPPAVRIAHLGPYTSGMISGHETSNATPTLYPFSLTLDLNISHNAGKVATSMNANLESMPEPCTILLLGMGLLGLGVIGRKKIGIKEV